ncbi:hypothetical protein CKK33_14775 [Mucilaginibacter sp. MD40]|uniref:DUF4932 domain-containing protein n=1 Tax=Mucilaginibacter sp. MD40 TaxID=2029590 RepID=UPI000BACD1F6|nr:DUF4932 domain-containing protein [Mucilaginibacter sp. MD40]PAW94689.1 hypothetical protein CKK33_14775 [Mucilaginibacter sp. MD40]
MKFFAKTLSAMALLCLVFSNQVQAQKFKSYQIKVNGIEYQIDPRIELLNAVAMLFGHNGMTPSNIPYKQQTLEYFRAYRQHPVVDSLLASYRYGWGVDDPIFFMLALDEHFHIRSGLDAGIVSRGGGRYRLEKLAKLFADFCIKANFYAYFNTKQAAFYNQVITQTAYNFRDFKVVPLMENYFGEQHSYVVDLNLMGGYGNFGKAYPLPNGHSKLYAVVATSTSSAEVPVFSPTIELFTLIIHEFSHGFINPSIDPYASRLDKNVSLYEPIKTAMQASGYYSWRSTVYETIVPAVVIRMAEQYYGKAFTEKNFYKFEMGKRFIYLDTLLARLEWYESHRRQYPHFKTFVPDLLTVFDHITPSYILSLQQKVANIRKPDILKIPKPYEFAHDSTTYFIVSTHEPDKQIQAKMLDWVKQYRDMISRESPIITDEDALKMDLTNSDIVLFGTRSGNSMIGRYLNKLPITILKDSVLTNKIIKGGHLQVVTSWVSPFNAHKAMVIYTGQRAEDIKNFNYSALKDQFGYWIAENTITLYKGDYVNFSQVWICDPR